MPYIDYEFYTSLHGTEVSEQDFNCLAWDACRRMDICTTGIDRVKKLKVALPTDEDDAESVRRCAAALVNLLYQIEQAEKAARSAQGYITREDGTITGKVVSSVSSGNESIGYATGNSSISDTRISAAVSNSSSREQLLNDTVKEYLSGIADANGVNLLYMGRYPVRLTAI